MFLFFFCLVFFYWSCQHYSYSVRIVVCSVSHHPCPAWFESIFHVEVTPLFLMLSVSCHLFSHLQQDELPRRHVPEVVWKARLAQACVPLVTCQVQMNPVPLTSPLWYVACCVCRASVGADGLASLICVWETENERNAPLCPNTLPNCYLPLLCRCHGYSALSPPLSSLSRWVWRDGAGEEWGEEKRSGSGCCLCVIFIPVQLRAPPLLPPSSFLPSFLPSLLPSFLLIIQFAHC